MARYIDADKIGIGFANPDVFENKPYAEGWNSAVEIIMNQPTVDLVREVHGHWKPKGNAIVCSVCAEPFFYVHIPQYKYCPMCGTKMDGKED